MSHTPLILAQAEPSLEPMPDGLRTFEGTTDNPAPVSVDSEGNPVYGSTIYLIFAIFAIGSLVVIFFFRRRPAA
ncbi:MAG: hypothetical protein ACO1RX_02745 [Candidatus Sericytochromatia bacterium]